MRWAATVIGLTLSAFVAAGCASRPAVATGAQAAAPDFSIVTYNVNFAAPRPDLAVRAVADAGADVVCLQETTPQWEAALREGLGGQYPHMYFRHEPAAGGIALLSKWPVSPPEFHLATAGWFPACIATVRTPAGPVEVVGVHLRPPVSDRGSFVSGYFTTPPVRRAEIVEIHAAATRRGRDRESGPDGSGRGVPRVFVGDFNEGHGGRAIRFLRNRGYRDALRRHAPYASTWRWQAGPIPLRGQLDHILYSGSLECLDATVLRQGASDHYPVRAEFLVRAEATPRPVRSGRYPSYPLTRASRGSAGFR